jgi:hypothetical protein
VFYLAIMMAHLTRASTRLRSLHEKLEEALAQSVASALPPSPLLLPLYIPLTNHTPLPSLRDTFQHPAAYLKRHGCDVVEPHSLEHASGQLLDDTILVAIGVSAFACTSHTCIVLTSPNQLGACRRRDPQGSAVRTQLEAA